MSTPPVDTLTSVTGGRRGMRTVGGAVKSARVSRRWSLRSSPSGSDSDGCGSSRKDVDMRLAAMCSLSADLSPSPLVAYCVVYFSNPARTQTKKSSLWVQLFFPLDEKNRKRPSADLKNFSGTLTVATQGAPVAQGIEHPPPKRGAASSNLAGRTILRSHG